MIWNGRMRRRGEDVEGGGGGGGGGEIQWLGNTFFKCSPSVAIPGGCEYLDFISP